MADTVDRLALLPARAADGSFPHEWVELRDGSVCVRPLDADQAALIDHARRRLPALCPAVPMEAAATALRFACYDGPGRGARRLFADEAALLGLVLDDFDALLAALLRLHWRPPWPP